METQNLKSRVVEEFYRYLTYALFLFGYLSAFTLYRNLLLREYEISVIHYGYDLIESLILAKVILLGEIFNFGKRYEDKPLICSTFYKTLIFSLFVLAFTLLEEFADGFFKGETMSHVYTVLLDTNIYKILAKILVMFFFFIFFFAFMEIGRVWGEGKLINLFFKKRGKDVH
jgi:hypothetical protein